MANKPPPRSIIKMILSNFINSFRPRRFSGDLMGEDYFGNKFYEIPANPSLGKRKPTRYFEPIGKENSFDQEMAAEWEAWLRGRRTDPPTKDELIRNLAIIDMKKRNAALIDEKFKTNKDDDELEKRVTGLKSFPIHKEYEIVPGKDKKPGT